MQNLIKIGAFHGFLAPLCTKEGGLGGPGQVGVQTYHNYLCNQLNVVCFIKSFQKCLLQLLVF